MTAANPAAHNHGVVESPRICSVCVCIRALEAELADLKERELPAWLRREKAWYATAHELRAERDALNVGKAGAMNALGMARSEIASLNRERDALKARVTEHHSGGYPSVCSECDQSHGRKARERKETPR